MGKQTQGGFPINQTWEGVYLVIPAPSYNQSLAALTWRQYLTPVLQTTGNTGRAKKFLVTMSGERKVQWSLVQVLLMLTVSAKVFSKSAMISIESEPSKH